MTALDIIKRSLRLLGAIDPNETPTATEAANGLEALNAMMDSWSLERLMLHAVVHSTQQIIAGKQEYTVGSLMAPPGPPGPPPFMPDWPMPRPIKVESIRLKEPCLVPFVNFATFEQNLDAPTITVRLDVMPTSNFTVDVVTWVPLESFPDLSTDVELSPGYERAIVYNLAGELSPEYPNCPLSQIGISIAVSSKAAIKRINAPEVRMECDAALLNRSCFDITRGY